MTGLRTCYALCGAICALLISTPAAAQPADGLILSLLSQPGSVPAALEPGSRLNDASPAGNHAVARRIPRPLRDVPAPSVALSHGAHFEVPASESFRGLKALSVSAWVQPTTRPTNWPILFGRWHDPESRSFFLYSSNKGLVEWGVSWSRTEYRILRDGPPLPVGTWTHIAATWDNATGLLRLYCNGALAGEDHTPVGVTLLDSDIPVLVGSHNNTPGGSGSFTGGMSRVCAWDRALTPDEIKTMFDQQREEYPLMPLQVDRKLPRLDAGSAKQLFLDDAILSQTDGVKLTMNRPERRGEPCIVTDKPWEQALNCFGVTVLQDGDQCRMYYNAWDAGTEWAGIELLFCYATSKDGIAWEKPELDLIPYGEAKGTNILYPDAEYRKEAGYFFGTCVFVDTNPACRRDEKYKMINGDSPTCVWSSPDGLHFKRMFDKPSFRPADTNNVMFFDNRIGRYVAYMRSWDPLRVVGRCEFDDLADFGPDTVVLGCDEQDQDALDKSLYTDVSFYNSSALKYPYAENAYLAFPSPFYHTPEPPVGRISNDGITDIQLAVSRDGVDWSRPSREPFMPLHEGEYGLYMAEGMVRSGNELNLYYGVYYNTHGDVLNERDHISRAVIRLDGFVSADADGEGTLTTVPLTFTGSHLELNAVGEEVRAALLDEAGNELPGFGLADCDPLTGDHIAATISWEGSGDVRALAGKTVRLKLAMKKAKVYAFQFAQ